MQRTYDDAMPPNAWARYVKDITAGAPQHAIADKSGIARSVLSRWLSGPPVRPSAVQAIKLARAYGRPPGEALAAGGYITAEEAGLAPDAQRGIESYSNEELIAEMERIYVAAGTPINEIAARFLGRRVDIESPLASKAYRHVRRKTDPARIETISNSELIAATTELMHDRSRLMDEIARRLLRSDG